VKYFTHLLFILIIITLWLIHPVKILAAKKFIPKTPSQNTKTNTVRSSVSIPSKVKYRPDKRGILLLFTNFNNLDSVSYSFTYTSNGLSQGAGGVIRKDNNPTSERELLFGTCSSGVCTYHQNIRSATLLLTAKYDNGKTSTKRYRIKSYL